MEEAQEKLIILMAEDDEMIGKMLANELRKQGDSVDVVYRLDTALAYLKRNEYNLIVLDLILADSGERGDPEGITTFDEIRKVTQTPVVVFAGRADEDLIQKLSDEGTSLILKPLNDILAFRATLRHNLASARSVRRLKANQQGAVNGLG